MTPGTPLLTALIPILLFSACHLPEKPVSDQEAGAIAKKIESPVGLIHPCYCRFSTASISETPRMFVKK